MAGRREKPKPARPLAGSLNAQGARSRTKVFLNLPYDKKFERLFLAYICGIQALGMGPRVALEITGGKRRLDRIFGLMKSCRFSVHDLSKVQVDRRPPSTPRFNMPFELGLAVAWERISNVGHIWFVMESVRHRLTKSLSDLNGTDHDSALFWATGPSQPLSHQSLPHSFPFNGGGGVSFSQKPGQTRARVTRR